MSVVKLTMAKDTVNGAKNLLFFIAGLDFRLTTINFVSGIDTILPF